MKNLKLSVLLLLTLAAACKKENMHMHDQDNKEIIYSLDRAKLLYESRPELKDKYRIDWSKAEPITAKGTTGWLLPVPGIPHSQGVSIGYRRLALYVDPKTGTEEASILDFVPDALALQRTAGDPSAKFSGRIMVFNTTDEKLEGGYIVSEGRKIGEVSSDSTLAKKRKLNFPSVQQSPIGARGRVSILHFMEMTIWDTYSYVSGGGIFTIVSERTTTYYIYDDGIGNSMPNYYSGPSDYGWEPAMGGGGDGGSHNVSDPTRIPEASNLPGEDSPKVDPEKMTKCFGTIPDAGATMKVTVLVQEAFPGTSFNIGPNSYGHVAISMTKSNGTESVTQVMGFYPNATGKSKYNAPSKILDNGGLEYNVSATYTVSAESFGKIIGYVNNHPGTYNADSYNCTNFVYEALKSGGVNLPDPTVAVGLGGPGGYSFAMTPAGLGQAYRDMKAANPNSNITTNTSKAPESKGECN